MTGPLAPTSKVGFYTQRMRTVWDWGPLHGPYNGTFSSNVVHSYSNKSALVRNSPPYVIGAPYTRKMATLVSSGNVDVKTTTHKVKGESSLHHSGVTMSARPHNCAYSSLAVAAPLWMSDKVIQDCLIDIQAIRANVLEDLAQAKSLLDMISSIMNTIIDLFLLARKGRWAAVRRNLRRLGNSPKKAASGWLMFYYGIKPLVGTIDALTSGREPVYKTLKVSRKVDLPIDIDDFFDINPILRPQYSGSGSFGVKCGMSIVVKCDADTRYWTSLGLGSDQWNNALVTGWALIPYSFVVDWLIPVERFLRTRSWSSEIEYQTGYVTKRLKGDGEATVLNPVEGFMDTGKYPKGKLRSLQLQRIAYNTFPPPSGLSAKLSLTPTQAFNAAALLTQAWS